MIMCNCNNTTLDKIDFPAIFLLSTYALLKVPTTIMRNIYAIFNAILFNIIANFLSYTRLNTKLHS